MSGNTKFHGIVRFDSTGEIVCFCSYEEYLRKGCACRERFDCPEAMIEITVLPGTKPSDRSMESLKKAGRKIKKVSKSINSIKWSFSSRKRHEKISHQIKD